jgi:putative spermidine/putrescine transport system permease protein
MARRTVRIGRGPSFGQIVSSAYLAFVYLFILAPMVVVIVGSFNSAIAFPSAFKSFTLHWYSALLKYSEFVSSLWVSIRVGVAAASLATVVGIPVALLLTRTEFRGKEAVNAFFMTPMIVPQIVLSLALLQLFSLARIRLNEITLICAHTVFVMPYVLRALVASLQFINPSLEEAALNLGASRWQTFLHITLPLIRSGITAGFILSFIMSFINLPLSLFLSTPARTTLPVRVFAYMESRLDPLVAAIGGLTIFVGAGLSLFLERVLKIRLIF